MVYFLIFLILFAAVFGLYLYEKQIKEYKYKQALAKKMYDQAITIKVQRKEQQQSLNKEISTLEAQKAKILSEIKQSQELAEKLKNQFKKNLDQETNLYKKDAQSELSSYKDKINNSLKEQQQKYQTSINQITSQLNKMKKLRASIQEALLRQEQVKQDQARYCLRPTPADQEDIDNLEQIRGKLHNPRILSMLIWQTYWQPLAKTQFPIILGSSATKTGIYKITNIITDECYIGQSLDIDKRFKQHCKYGLGIDTPAGNKLYKAIDQYGLQNFSFEVLQECTKDELNQKEKFYIDFYDSYNFGYNSNKGISK